MENASKALLIAGAILLVIAIIGIGMAIFTQASNVIDTGGKQIDTLAVQAHNSMFDSYIDKTVKGKAVKDLGSRVASYNQTADTNFIVTINLVAAGETTGKILVDKNGLAKADASTATLLSTGVDANKNYKVTGDMDATTGIITTITITAQ